MGGCSSTTSSDAGGAPVDQPRTRKPEQGKGPASPPSRAAAQEIRKKPSPSKDDDVIKSLTRVASKVPPSGARVRSNGAAAARASSYDHVHSAVLTSFESRGLKRKMGVVGLHNLGNTGFLNSSLQCLSNTIPLSDYILGYDYRKEINRDNPLGTKGVLVEAYAELMKQMWLGGRKPIEPKAFKDQLFRVAPQFSGGEQQDAQEVLSFLLDRIHEDLNRVKRRPFIEEKDFAGTNDQEDAVWAWENHLRRNRSILVDIFQGQLRNTMTCLNQECGHRHVRFEPFMYLSLPILHGSCSLEECLDLYCTEERLTGENKWFCPGCQMHVDAIKKFDLWMLPPILIVQLKRFDASGDKIETPIHYPVQDWDLSAAVKSSSGLFPRFDLYAVANHGKYAHLGGREHYTAFVKNRFDETWYGMNDSETRKLKVSKELFNNPNAYCLFYNRVEERVKDEPRKRGVVKVRRQSKDHPESWPHLQFTTDFRSFRRSTQGSEVQTISEEE